MQTFYFFSDGAFDRGLIVAWTNRTLETKYQYFLQCQFQEGDLLKQENPINRGNITTHKGGSLTIWKTEKSYIVGELQEDEVGEYRFLFVHFDASRYSEDQIKSRFSEGSSR